MTGARLAGRRIAVTRPAGQAANLAALIAGEGGVVVPAPLLEIAPVEDGSALHGVAERLADSALAVFISPNAVNYALPVLLAGRSWPDGTRPAAVGQGTVRALAAHGVVGCLAPTERFDSESLLALSALQADRIAGRRVTIFRGDGGRELLAETLTARGAVVDLVTCYRRQPPGEGLTALRKALCEEEVDALTLSSSEALRYLMAGLSSAEQAMLRTLPVFVPHARIAESARYAGFNDVMLTEPGDDGMTSGLCAYNWRR